MTTELTRTLQQEGIVVIGEGAASAVPDVVVLTVGIERSGINAVQALSETTTLMMRVVQALLDKGIPQTDMQTTWVGIYPFQSLAGQFQNPGLGANPFSSPAGQTQNFGYSAYPQNGQQIAHEVSAHLSGLGMYPQNIHPANQATATPTAGFMAGSWLRISLREPNHIGEILDAAIAAGASYGSGHSLRLKDDSTARRAALEAAGTDARAKAELLAVAMGKQLGAPVRVVEEASFSGSPVLGSAASSQLGGSSGGFNYNALPSSPGEIIFTTRLRVTYELT